MKDLEVDLLTRLTRWYAAQCNGDWEHTYGITLETVDNPGWHFKVDLTDTDLSDRAFHEISEHQGGDENAFLCRVKDRAFDCFCAPHRLHEVISIFLRWAENGSDA
jgi:Immunity protein 53